ncbi:epoxide hydrolase family protein [Actinomycetospora cinnamomea]|uniref:Pimeloyl-ACP methyl ester carboxylesterase n=1 Tax=Actinomycetospora cinnamomea TaxID=663609 RepID=A0A2U1FKW0_9PSEU|nr:epoxide hydrolase [Actinomycetospora cinnamomea]PVZ12855.1 pimeloyl-ACP methyl ester carboxylesterase [Actinomycetospora cinnamomea]
MAASAPVPTGDPSVEVVPFVLDVPDEQLLDLRERLRRVRLPEPATDPSQGLGLDAVTELCRAWLEEHDWRRVEDELNRRGQYRTAIDGLGVHFLHVRSPRRDALPLIITHGWPGSVVEVLDVLDALTDPGDDTRPAFHVVAPSLPGYAFSDKPTAPGWGVERIADAWAELMTRLGYERFLAQGGDWGAMITTSLALRHPDRVAMMHTTMPIAPRPEGFDDAMLAELDETERRWLAGTDEFRRVGSGYSGQQRTRPQTLGYGLVDSPAGQLAWMAEKFVAWTDGDGFGGVPRDRVLDNAAVYWLTASGASSARLYWESFARGDLSPVTVPSAVSYFPAEMVKVPRAWVEARYTDLRHWNVLPTGGHFASLEVPGDFVDELRTAFALARS